MSRAAKVTADSNSGLDKAYRPACELFSNFLGAKIFLVKSSDERQLRETLKRLLARLTSQEFAPNARALLSKDPY